MYQVQGNENTKIENLQQGNNYSSERSAWGRPQLMVWSKEAGVVGQPAGIANSSGDLVGNTYPLGIEGQDFIITSDHNRSSLSVPPDWYHRWPRRPRPFWHPKEEQPGTCRKANGRPKHPGWGR